jgi:monofunctional biosynthetic peptidoglycan transglycosylase
VLAAIALCVAIAVVRVGPIDVRGLARHEPGRSAVMLEREREAREQGLPYHESRRWVALEHVSATLRRAVLVAEDDKFFTHDGLDWDEIRLSAQKNLRAHRVVRGGSTITQQLAKNLWLGSSRTPWRKFEEMILAVRLERDLSKRRILELYLNTIEWGEGIYGADAAARYWFGVGAGSLDANQSIRLAAVIINPRRFSPVAPDDRIRNRIQLIAGRLRRRGAISEEQYRVTLGLPPEAEAPAVDSTLFAPPDTSAPAPLEGAPPPPDAAAPDSTPPDSLEPGR